MRYDPGVGDTEIRRHGDVADEARMKITRVRPWIVQGDALLVPKKPGLGVKLDVECLKANEIEG